MSRLWQHRAARHALFWLATVALSFAAQLPAHWLGGAPLYVGGLFFVQLPASLLAIYPLLYWILPRLLRGQLVLLVLLLALWLPASIKLVNLMRGLYERGPAPAWFGEPKAPVQPWYTYKDLGYAWFVLLATAGAASTIKVLNGWHEQQRQGRELQQRKLQAELQLLKAQLQPAFLFDTLGTLRRLTAERAAEAPAAVLHLAELLRYLLYESPRDAVPLADEVAMLRHYLALETLRLGPRVEVSLHFSGALAESSIAPLLLLPLLENAFRYGTGTRQECPWVSIDLVAKSRSLTFKVINSQPNAPADWHEGPGLRTLRQRLERLYPGRHELKIVAEPDTFLVALRLRFAPMPGHISSPSPALALPQP